MGPRFSAVKGNTHMRARRLETILYGVERLLGVLFPIWAGFLLTFGFAASAQEPMQRTRQLQAGTALDQSTLSALFDQGRYSEAGEIVRNALAAAERQSGGDSPTVMNCLGALVLFLVAQDKQAEAEEILRRFRAVEEKMSARFGMAPAGLTASLQMLSVVRSTSTGQTEQPQEKETVCRNLLLLQEKVFGQTYPAIAWTLLHHAFWQGELGRKEDALASVKRILAMYEQTRNLDFLGLLGDSVIWGARTEEAADLLGRALEALPEEKRRYQPVVRAMQALAQAYKLFRRVDKEQAVYSKMLAAARAAGPMASTQAAIAEVELLIGQGRCAEARAILEKSFQEPGAQNVSHPLYLRRSWLLGKAYHREGKVEEAKGVYKKTAPLCWAHYCGGGAPPVVFAGHFRQPLDLLTEIDEAEEGKKYYQERFGACPVAGLPENLLGAVWIQEGPAD